MKAYCIQFRLVSRIDCNINLFLFVFSFSTSSFLIHFSLFFLISFLFDTHTVLIDIFYNFLRSFNKLKYLQSRALQVSVLKWYGWVVDKPHARICCNLRNIHSQWLKSVYLYDKAITFFYRKSLISSDT